MPEANDISPDHYAGSYQVWDFVIKIPLGYLEGNTVKYVTRWRKKDGMKDLEKAMHYLEKLIENKDLPISPYHNLTDPQVVTEIKAFASANDLTTLEVDFLVCICQGYLDEAHTTLSIIIEQAKTDLFKAHTVA
jgi:hypothetical protein